MRASLAATIVAGFVLLAPATALAADAAIDGTRALPDRDTRTGKIRPDAAQRAGARALGAQVNWNRFGTPSSLVDPGGALATGVRGATAAAAARAWLDANKALFRLDSTAGLELQSDSELAGGAGHAVTLRQTIGGLEAGGGGLVTIGLKRDGDWHVISAAGSLHGGTTLAGEAAARARGGRAEGRARTRVRSVRWRRSSRPRSRARRASRASSWPGSPTSSPRGRWRSRPSATAGSRPTRRWSLDTAGVRARGPTAPTWTRAAARSSPARASSTTPRRPRPGPVTFAGELPPQDGGCDVLKGPYTVAAGAGVRAIDVFADADTPAQDIVLKLFLGTSLVAQADTLPHARADPLRARRRRPGRRLPRPGVRVRRRRPAGRAAHVLGHRHARRQHAARALHRALDAFGGTPPQNALDADPWNNPSTDTREEWCWKASSAADDCDEVVGNLAARSPWDYDPRVQRVLEHDGRQQRPVGRVLDRRRLPRRLPVPPGERRARLHIPVDQRLEHRRLQPRHALRRRVRRRRELRHRRGDDQPVRPAQPDARLGLRARVHRGQLERPGRRTSASPRPTARTTRCSAAPRPARPRRRPASTPPRATTRT